MSALKMTSGGSEEFMEERVPLKKGCVACFLVFLFLLAVLAGCFPDRNDQRDQVRQMTREELEDEYARLKTKYELLKRKTPKRYLLLEDADGKIEKTAEYYYRKGLDFQDIDTLTAYDYFKEVYSRFPDDNRAQDAHEQMVRIERTLYETINKELNGKKTLNGKIECLEQNLLVYHDYLNKSFLELLIHELRRLKFEKENKS